MREQVAIALADARLRLDQVNAKHAELEQQMRELNAQGVAVEREQIAVTGEIKALEDLLKG